MIMSQCPFCNQSISAFQNECPHCGAHKAYYFLSNFTLNRNMLILFGLVAPFFIALFSISAQNELGVAVCIAMIIPVIISIFKLIAGKRWVKGSKVN